MIWPLLRFDVRLFTLHRSACETSMEARKKKVLHREIGQKNKKSKKYELDGLLKCENQSMACI